MRPTELSATLEWMLNSPRPVFIWGPPGVCKSSVVRQAAAKAGRPIVDVRAVLLDPVDLRGLPRVTKDGRAEWCPPSFLPHDPNSKAIVFLDELAQAPAMVQSACLQLTLDRRLGEYELPKGCSIIAASNRQGDRAGAQRIITPLLNRFVHLEVDVSTDDWQAWSLGAGVDQRVRAFIAFKPTMLFDFDPKADNRAFPTPRSWEFVSDLLQAMAKASGHINIFEAASGCVGQGAAAEFRAFCEIYTQLPNVAEVLKAAATAPVPSGSSPGVLYALCGALVDHLKNHPATADAVATYASRLPDEFAVLAMRDAAGIAPGVLTTKAGAAWLRANRATIAPTA